MKSEERIHRFFEAGLAVKAVFSALEILGAAAVFFVSGPAVHHVVMHFSRARVLAEPHDVLIDRMLQSADSLASGGQTFAALYLLSHGLIKLALVILVWRGSAWAYPVFMGVLTFFIAYQSYRMAVVFSVPLLALTLFDLVVLVLAWKEWRYRETTAMQAAAPQ